MKKMKYSLIATFLVFLLPMSANAELIVFEYTYLNGSVLAGSLDGDVQGDNDTVFINSFGEVTFEGVALNSIENDEICSVSDFSSCAEQPLISLSGAIMDVFVCTLGFDGGNCGFVQDGGFFFRVNGFAGDTAAAQPGGAFITDDPFSADRWIATRETAQVPEPGTLAMLGLGLLGMRLATRKKSA